MRRKKEGRKKEASKVKQINKAKQHSMSCLRWDSNPRHSNTLDRAHVCVAIIPMSISSNVTKLNSRVHYSGEVVE